MDLELTDKERSRLFKLKKKLDELEDKRERNVNRYIIPVERDIAITRDKISDIISKTPLP